MNFKKVNEKDHIAMSSETAPDEKLSNLPAKDMIARAVQLADSIEDYDLYCRYVRQEFGLNDSGLRKVIDEAMKVIADRALNGDKPGKAGTVTSPSNEPGERPIDVKAGSERKPSKVPAVKKFSGHLYVGDKVTPGFFGEPKVEKSEPVISFKKALNSLKGFVSYNQSHKNSESTQTTFKKFWKKDVQTQYYRTEKTTNDVDNTTSEAEMYGGGTQNEDNSQQAEKASKKFKVTYTWSNVGEEQMRTSSRIIDAKDEREARHYVDLDISETGSGKGKVLSVELEKSVTQKAIAEINQFLKEMERCPKCGEDFDITKNDGECPECGNII